MGQLTLIEHCPNFSVVIRQQTVDELHEGLQSVSTRYQPLHLTCHLTMASYHSTNNSRENHHYGSVREAIWQTTKEPTITLRRIYSENGENVKHKLDSLPLSTEGPCLLQQILERPSPGPEILAPQDWQSIRYCLSEMRHGGGAC